MANYRQIHVSIWKDTYFLELDPKEKLLFVYLFSNESSSLAGIYEISIKVICFETGLDNDFVVNALDKFEKDEKIYYQNGIVWVKNLRKYNKGGQTVYKRVIADIQLIPDCELKKRYLDYYRVDIPYIYPMDTLSKNNSSLQGYPMDRVSYEMKWNEIKGNENEMKFNENDETETKIENWEPTPYSQLSTAFVNATRIPEYSGGAQKWNEAITAMVEVGIEPEDVEKAVEILDEKDYTIVNPGSVQNTALDCMRKRLGKSTKDPLRQTDKSRSKYKDWES